MVPDFTGYVTKYGIKCSDGRTILAHAFKADDGQKIPLVWQHQHNDPMNVLGHLILQHKDDGVYAQGFFNETDSGQQAKTLVKHGDIKNLSIYANQLSQQGSNVVHGKIREGSLVMAGANPGAFIDNINIQHGDDVKQLDDEAIIYIDDELSLEHADSPPAPSGTDENSQTIADVFGTLNDAQKNVVYALIGAALNHSDTSSSIDDAGEAAKVFDTLSEKQKVVVQEMIKEALVHAGPGDDTDTDDNNTDTQEGSDMGRNVFDQTDKDQKPAGYTLTHEDARGIFMAARKGGSLKDAVDEFAIAHGINDISTLFPYDQAVTDTPEFISRRMEWVQGVLGAVRKTPFSRIRSWSADLTLDEARAKGYVTGSLKKEEFFSISRRITTPQTVYKKQKLDRDDILDITDFDVVTWLQTEMRIMLDEELARAILVGDGREVDDADKIDPTHVRPIMGDDSMYVTTLDVDLSDSSSSADEIVDAVVTGMRYYRGSGNPVMYTTLPYMSKMLLAKDTLGRRLYPTKVELAAALGVSDVIPCEALEATSNLIGIIVNLLDYTCGQDRGGQVSMFDFFDIDYNQFKYLMETRMSGAMTKYKGALQIMEFTGAGGMLPNPTAPTFVDSTGVGTIPTTTHVSYVVVDDSDGSEGSALDAGAQTAISAGASVHYRAKAASTYSFADNANQDWTFTRDAS